MREHAIAAAAPHQSRRLRTQSSRWQVPIVDRSCRIVGWTSASPETVGAILRHAEAEKLLGGPVTGIYVQIADPAAAERAGAPAGWDAPWRCIAIVALGDAGRHRKEASPLLDVYV